MSRSCDDTNGPGFPPLFALAPRPVIKKAGVSLGTRLPTYHLKINREPGFWGGGGGVGGGGEFVIGPLGTVSLYFYGRLTLVLFSLNLD